MQIQRQIRRFLAIWIFVTCLLSVACRSEPTELEQKQTPFATYNKMLAISVTANRLASPTIDNVEWLDQGRVSTPVPGNGRLKLLREDRTELLVLDFEINYSMTGSDVLRDSVLLTFVMPHSSEVFSIRLETPQGSDEVLLTEVIETQTDQ
jgi:hypothetical protein